MEERDILKLILGAIATVGYMVYWFSRRKKKGLG